MSYALIKQIHVATVSFSILFFIIRGVWKFNHVNWYRKRWIRKLSQFNDTILLACGVFMAFSIQQYPFVNAWLTAKLIALVSYILLGMAALYWLRARALQVGAWLLAIGVYGYIAGVALNKNPAWFAALL